MSPAPTLADYLTENAAPQTGAVILGVSDTVIQIAERIAGFGVDQALAAEAGRCFVSAMAAQPVRFLASQAENGVSEVTPDGTLALACEPLDCPGISANAASGTLFSLYPSAATAVASFLRPGADQIAAGCIAYGPRTTLALTAGQGTALFILDRESREFRLEAPRTTIRAGVSEFAANAAEYRHWERPVQRFVDDCLAGADGPSELNFDMRWTGCLAAEVHRVLTGGGIYLSPRGTGTPLRHLHHCQPVAMLIEQAGGQATDGMTAILELTPEALDANSPLVFGSPGKVARVAAYHDMPDNEVSPLFGRRGLFRI
jgi:fructose-1,6-bisphosphatase I